MQTNRTRVLAWVLAVLLAGAAAVPASAQIERDRPTPPGEPGPATVFSRLAEAGDAADHPGADYVIVLDLSVNRVMENGVTYVDLYQITKILTEAGAAEKSALQWHYDPQSSFVKVAEVNVVRDGRRIPVDLSALRDLPAPQHMIYWGDRIQVLQLPRLRVGTWTVFFFGTPSDLTPRGSRLAAVRVGEVEIFANLHSPFDIVLEGNRRLSGAFAMSDIPGGMIELELTPEWAVDSVSASGWVITPIAKEGKEVGGERGEPRERRLVPGQFTFEGLMPSVYRLKITFGHDTESGEELFLERTIDLSDGDVSLEAETFTLLDFAFPTHER